MMNSNSIKYQHRMNRAINLIREDVSNKLHIDQLADEACLSKFHFSRLFASYLNETPHQFVTRIRIENAANRLLHERDESITIIALDSGFSGSDTFARAFRRRFSNSAKVFKNASSLRVDELNLSAVLHAKIHRPGIILDTAEIDALKVSIEHRPEYKIAYVRYFGPYGDLGSGISNAFSKLIEWAGDKKMLHKGSCFVGRTYDNCAITPAHQCMYDAGIVIESDMTEDETVSMQTIPRGLYAVVDVSCKAEQIHRIWDWLRSGWLAASKWQKRQSATYEFTPGYSFSSNSSEIECQLCLPIE